MTILQNVIASVLPARQPVITLPDFWTVFGSGVTVASPTFGPVAKHVHLTISGTDSITGYSHTALSSIYGSGTQYEFWGIGDMADAADMDAAPEHLTYFTQTITTPANPLIKGGRQVTNGCNIRVTGAPNPQTHVYVGIQSAAALATPVESQYYEIDFILPAGLDLQAGDTGTGKFWVSPLEVKTGAWYDTGAAAYKQAIGDFRIKVGCTGIDTGGVNRWQVIADNEANGRSVIPELSVAPYDDVYKYVDITNTDEPVRLGVRTKAKIWYRRPASAADLTSGRLRVVIKAEGYAAFELCNVVGGQLCGQLNLPITRIFFGSNYTSAELPNPTILESVQIYDQPSDGLQKVLFSPAILFGILHGPYSYTPTVPTGVVKYVSPTGTGVGTIDDPMSIADANDSALPGDHFWLRDGAYTIPLNGIRFYEGGTSWAPGKYVTYESYPGEQAVFDGAANQAEEADVRVKLQNKFVCLRKVEIKNCSLQGVEMSGTDNKVEFCEIHDCWLSGILAAVSGGTASHPYVNGRNIIRSNTIYNCSDVGHLTGSYANGGNADAISVTSGISNIVEYNRCYNCGDDGIDVWRSTGSIIRYNLVYGMGLGDGNGNGFKCGGSPSGTTYSTDHIFAYNISVGNKSSGFSGNNGVRTYLYHNTTALNPVGYDDFDSTTRLIGNIAAEAARYTGSITGHSGNSWDVAAGTTPTFIGTDPSSDDYYKPPAGNVFEDIGAYAA